MLVLLAQADTARALMAQLLHVPRAVVLLLCAIALCSHVPFAKFLSSTSAVLRLYWFQPLTAAISLP
jgi:hypothetical protein